MSDETIAGDEEYEYWKKIDKETKNKANSFKKGKGKGKGGRGYGRGKGGGGRGFKKGRKSY